jgi:hypothetical protein
MPSNSRHRKRRAATVFGDKYADREKAAGESRFIALSITWSWINLTISQQPQT